MVVNEKCVGDEEYMRRRAHREGKRGSCAFVERISR